MLARPCDISFVINGGLRKIEGLGLIVSGVVVRWVGVVFDG